MTEPLQKKQKQKQKQQQNSSSPSISASTSGAGSSKIHRAISACKRCRSKKIKCEGFPQCDKCKAHNVECVGFDIATGRDVPRSYIVHLESRIKELEVELKKQNVTTTTTTKTNTTSPTESGICYMSNGHSNFSGDGNGNAEIVSNTLKPIIAPTLNRTATASSTTAPATHGAGDSMSKKHGDENITFLKLISTAFKVQRRNEEKAAYTEDSGVSRSVSVEATAAAATATAAAPIQVDREGQEEEAAVLPPKSTALHFCQIFFHQCNPQFPIFHREEFIRNIFIPIYGPVAKKQFNFASNNGAINEDFWRDEIESEGSLDYWFNEYKQQIQHLLSQSKDPNPNVKKISSTIKPPRRFYKPLYFLNLVFAIASSVHHLRYPPHISESFRLAAMRYYDDVKNNNLDQLNVLQGILLYAYYAIMRPTNPGIWYIMGDALRLCVDLDLQNELKTKSKQNFNIDQYTRDKRRRLFWCTYTIDRQICFYLDRPFGIPDESINTPLPTVLDDLELVPKDYSTAYGDRSQDRYGSNYNNNNNNNTNTNTTNTNSTDTEVISYKTVSNAFITIRKIQSEVTKILYTGSEIPRKYKDLNEWKDDILYRLRVWYMNVPSHREMNCDFNPIFFRLNYHHTLLYIHGLGPRHFNLSLQDFEQVATSAKEIIDIYVQLLITKSVNYTWAGVHNLFMAGTSYLYTLYNSEEIRKLNPFSSVQYYTSNCLQVLLSLMDKCEAASYCCEIFRNLTMVIIKMKYQEDANNNTSATDINNGTGITDGTTGTITTNNHSNGPSDEMPVNREVLYKINNGNVHSNLFSLVTELDALNPLNSPEFTSGGQIVEGKNSFGAEKTQSFHPNSHSHIPTALDTLSTVAVSPFPNIDRLDWNKDDLEFFFKELDHTQTAHTSLEKSSPGNNREAKMTFELMHNMPNEKIWDEFFTMR